MTKDSLEELMVIKSLLDLLCCSLGPKVNLNKSTFHHSGIQGEDLEKLKEDFTFNFVELYECFRYLGYFIKVEKSTFEDWRWLISKFENRTSHWCNR